MQTYINEYLYEIGVRWHWAISPKLFNTSGEVGQVLVDTFMSYIDSTKSTGIIKFVCNGSEESWQEIEYCANEIRLFSKRAEISTPDIWIMPVGALEETQKDNAAMIAEQTMDRGYNVSARVHCYIWGNQIGT